MDNKKIAGMLLKVQMDDLKDADMLIDYAEEAKREGDASIASAMYTRAKQRLSQMNECKRTIDSVMMRAEQEASSMGETFNKDGIYSELYNNWINSWEERLMAKMM